MLPFFSLHTISLGPITIQTWGLFVAAGILLGTVAAGRMARARGQDTGAVWDAAFWIVLGSMVGARLFHVAFYEPARYAADPLAILAIWKGGLSMFGGLAGATAAALAFLWRRKLNLFSYADTLAFGLPFGMVVGRLGCFLIHDHPGMPTAFALGVRYPDGTIRHDLGLYESLFGLVLALAFLGVARRNVRPPAYLAAFLVSYGTFRLFADTLRVADARYLGFTPAQYLSAGLVVAGAWMIFRILSDKK